MYAILKLDNTIGAFETRETPLQDLVPEEFRSLYVQIPPDHTLKVGDLWDPETQTWTISEGVPEEIALPGEPYQPTNAEIAQMISDLYADLVIGGVIL